MASQQDALTFVTLGTAVLDEIIQPNGTSMTNVLGGSGVYAMLGARIFANDPKQLGWLIQSGDDFPDDAKQQITDWATSASFASVKGPSTRGRLEYTDIDTKSFKYTTPVLRPSVEQLVNTPLLHAKSYHIFADPALLVTQVQHLLAARLAAGNSAPPFITWEPLRSACVKHRADEVIAAMAVVDCFSPNHLELASLLGLPDSFGAGVLEGLINAMAMQMIIQMRGAGARPPMILVRAAERGATLIHAEQGEETRPLRVPAYYASEGNGKVVDPTGAGNAFLGAFTAAYATTLDLEEALCRGSVAASFALEQTGLPQRGMSAEKEVWNGALAWERLAEFKQSLR